MSECRPKADRSFGFHSDVFTHLLLARFSTRPAEYSWAMEEPRKRNRIAADRQPGLTMLPWSSAPVFHANKTVQLIWAAGCTMLIQHIRAERLYTKISKLKQSGFLGLLRLIELRAAIWQPTSDLCIVWMCLDASTLCLDS